jgi:hypothetical protein
VTDPRPLRAILHRALARYLTVTSRGFVLEGQTDPQPRLVVRILSYGGARTLYQNRRPTCRSLDGIAAIADPAKQCQECPQADRCTPQVRLDLVVDSKPYRLLLSFTSAKNFLAHVGRLEAARVAIDSLQHEFVVLPRSGWGEIQFREAR